MKNLPLRWLRLGLVLLIPLLAMTQAHAQQNYKTGSLVNLTSVDGAILIMLDSGLPENCAGTPWGWMLVPRKSKEVQTMILLFYAMGKKAGTVYTSGRPEGGYCEVTQWDPHE